MDVSEARLEENYAEANNLLSFLSHAIKVGDQANIDKALEQVECFRIKTAKKTRTMYNHAFTVAFTVDSEHEDPGDIQAHDILEGLTKRVQALSSVDDDDNVLEACEPYDVYDFEE